MMATMNTFLSKAPLALTFCLLAGVGQPARAQDLRCDESPDFPCTYDVREVQVVRSTPTLKFQARMAQSGLPVSDTTFSILFVKLLRGTETICLEQFKNVPVKGGVINLEIGPNMSCPIDEAIGEHNDLAFQVCPGSVQNCLKPTSLGTSPYAFKSSFASVSQEAYRANVAGQASYAHRMTADRDMLMRNTIGIGYFDFSTPTAAEAVELYPTRTDFIDFENSGFVTWVPTRETTAMKVHLGGKNHASDRLAELTSLHVMSASTMASGDLLVTPPPAGKGLTVLARGAHVTGDSDIDGTLWTSDALTVASGGANIAGDSHIRGKLEMSRELRVSSEGLHVTGASTVRGELTVGEMLTVLSGGVRWNGATDLDGTLDVAGRMTVSGGDLVVTGDSTFTGNATVGLGLAVSQGGVHVSSGGVRVTTGGLVIGGGGLTVNGDATFSERVSATDFEVSGATSVVGANGFPHRFFGVNGNKLVMNPDETLTDTLVERQIRFTDQVIFDGLTIDPQQAEVFILSSGESRDLTLGGTLDAVGATRLSGGIIGGLDVSGASTLAGGVSVPDGLQGDLDVTGALIVRSPTALTGTATLTRGVSGNLAISGALSGASLAVSGTSTLRGVTSLVGGVLGPVNFANQVTVSAAGALRAYGPTTVAALTVNDTLQANGATRFEGAVTLSGGVAGSTTFGSNITVTGGATLNGATGVIGNLAVDGTARFNGSVNFGGSFNGTTRFQNVAASGALNVDGLTIFSGAAAFPGGVTGNLGLDTVNVTSGLSVAGTTIFDGPVDFRSTVSGITNLTAYVKASGETRPLTLPSLVVKGDMSVGSLATGAGFSHLTVTSSLNQTGNLGIEGAGFFDGGLTTSDDVEVAGEISVAGCRLCINYADTGGTDPADRRYACIRWQGGADSSMLHFLGDVDDNDVIGLKFLCDDGPSGIGQGWK
jgi:hypothetical protein